MLGQISRWLVRHPGVVLTFVCTTTLLAALKAVHVRFDFSPQAIHQAGDDAVAFAEQFKQTFGYEDSVLMVVLEATGERDVLDVAPLSWQLEAARKLNKLSGVVAVQSVATLQVPQFSLEATGELPIVPIIDQLPVDLATEGRLRRLVAQSRMLQGTLLRADRTVSAIVVAIAPDRRDAEQTREVVDAVERTLSELPPPDDYHVHVGGLPALRADIVKNLQADQGRLLPLAGLMFVAALGIVFRRLSGTLVPLLAVGVGLAWMTAMMAVAGQAFNILSNILPVMLLIVGVSNSVHIICRYAEESRTPDRTRREAMEETMLHLANACFLTFFTTAAGFGSLILARSELLGSFGWQAGMGIGLLYVSVIMVTGGLLPFFRPPRFVGTSNVGLPLLTRIVGSTGYAVARHPFKALVGAIVVLASACFVCRNVSVNSSMIETYDAEHPTIRTLQIIENKLGGMLPIEVSLTADNSDRFLDPAVYRNVAAFERFALDQEGVLFARSYVDLHQEVYSRFKDDDSLYDVLPAADDEGSSRIARSNSLISRAAGAMHYSTFMAAEGKQARILLRVRNLGTRELLPVIEQLEQTLKEMFPADSGVSFRLTGDALLNAHAMDGFIRDLFRSLVTAAAVIFAVIAVIFRSLRIGLIAAIPNLTPMLLTLGYIGLRGYDLNAGNVIVFSISLGITVDNTIHFLSRFQEEYARESDIHRAIRLTFESTGRAIVLTTLLIVFGLTVLLFSTFVPTRRFAELTSVTMLAALAGIVFTLPVCVVLFWKRRHSTTPVSDAPTEVT